MLYTFLDDVADCLKSIFFIVLYSCGSVCVTVGTVGFLFFILTEICHAIR